MDIRLPRSIPVLFALAVSSAPLLAAAQAPSRPAGRVQPLAVHRVAIGHHAVAPTPLHVDAPPRPAAIAQEDPPKDDHTDDRARDDRPHNAGVAEGHVVSVDYQRGVIGLMTSDRGRVDVMVLPSTNIQGRGDGFHTIADIARGSRLRVFLSQRAGQLFAQIIHLR
jgi:hypothetical protein